MKGRDKRVTTAAGKGWQQGTAAGDESINNRQREWRAVKRAMATRAMAMAMTMAKRWWASNGNGDGDNESNGEGSEGGEGGR